MSKHIFQKIRFDLKKELNFERFEDLSPNLYSVTSKYLVNLKLRKNSIVFCHIQNTFNILISMISDNF
jgi:hypothetical protein